MKSIREECFEILEMIERTYKGEDYESHDRIDPSSTKEMAYTNRRP